MSLPLPLNLQEMPIKRLGIGTAFRDTLQFLLGGLDAKLGKLDQCRIFNGHTVLGGREGMRIIHAVLHSTFSPSRSLATGTTY